MEFESVDTLPVDKRIKEILIARGIKYLNPVQTEAIRKGLLDGKNLLLASPTGSGKTLIAELGIINYLISNPSSKAVYVTPLRALTNEKFLIFKTWESIGFKVAMTSGDYDSDDEFLEDYDIIITTYEKLDSLWRHRPSWLNKVSYFVLDELHYINDGDRGPIVESVAVRAKRRKILALSATISNYEEIAKWLNAEFINVNWRPVPLIEGVMYQEGREHILIFNNGTIKRIKGEDGIIAYALETIYKGGQVLIFRNSRRMAETTAKKLAQYMNFVNLSNKELLEISNRIQEIEDAGLNEKSELSKLVIRGIAYHHAGLSKSLRDVIENAFRDRLIKIIVATPTLAAGVNLPARVVIVGDIYRYNRRIIGFQEEIPIMEYKQMSGRAGRPGYDEIGEAIIIAKDKRTATRIFEKYIKSPPEPIESRLGNERAFYSFILGTLSAEGEMSLKEIYNYTLQTLLPKSIIDKYFKKAIEWLTDNEFIISDKKIFLTKFGKRVADLYINPFTAKELKDALLKNEPECELAYLHLIASTPDGIKISVGKREVEELVSSVECELFLEEPNEDDYEEFYNYVGALKTALITLDWINEVDENVVLERYGIGSGDLRNIIETMEWLSYSAYHVANVLNYNLHAEKLKLINLRIRDGVREDLLELVKIPYIGRKRARLLYENGIKSIEDVVLNKEKVKSLLGSKIGERVVEEASRFLSRIH
jgi:helicase